MIHESKDHAWYIYCCVSSNMLGTELVVSKYLLSEQMNNPILIIHVGRSQEVGRLKNTTTTVNSISLLKCYSCA